MISCHQSDCRNSQEKERKTWQSYTFKTRNTYQERFDEIMKLIIGILFPNDVDEVIDDIKCPKQLNEENRTSHTEYKDIVTSYRKAESWQQGDSSMLKILAQCGAKVRKSLEGLDYFVAEGGRAFITFQDVLDKLLTYDAISPDDHKSFQALFLQSKQYLRTDYKVQQATKSIFSLKKHIIRCKNQDLAKTHLFETMPSGEVLLVCDWAMKFLPRKFREDQCDWFGKRGIPWHISIAFCRKDDGSIGSLGFVHLFATQISQDSQVTASIIQDVMDKIIEINTNDIKFHVWSDNAGCYKSTEMLSFLFHSGLTLSFDFCESQNGKGPFDRTAATIKSSIRRYVNQGHDVLTAQSMKKAIDKSAKNVKYIVRVIEGTECRKTKYTAIPAISTYSNFTFSAHGITAWKAYQVGTGKLIPSSDIPSVEKCILNTSCPEIEGEIDVDFRQLPLNMLKAEKEENTITCANEGCTLSFSSFHDLSSHLMFGKCEFEFRCQFSNGYNITKKTYITKISKSFSTNFQVSSAGLTVGINDNSDLELGWALKEERKNKRFNVNQKEYLTEKFNKGLKTCRKEDPFLVSEEMLTERKEDGNRRFSYDEILSVQQITSFFSRMSRKNKSFDDSVDASREETITIRRELTADELN
ncbi:uncharacterized protein LOC134726283 [Mytilus trossulus]|uniref:uncharacterized protein LOC134726283 n=1 Tax=Mytilus trossulus TaxID=6551 RepID=UPI003007B571